MRRANKASGVKKLMYKLCPHSYSTVPDEGQPVMFEVTQRERCRICGKYRITARVPAPHPTHDKDELLQRLQRPGNEFVVEEWLPYNSEGSE